MHQIARPQRSGKRNLLFKFVRCSINNRISPTTVINVDTYLFVIKMKTNTLRNTGYHHAI